jgi:hypothetical protein
MKYEIKIEFQDSKELEDIIKKCYFDNGNNGRLHNEKNFLSIKKEDVLSTLFTGLSNSTIRITNDAMIDGIMRFVIEETKKEIKLYPCSIYCIIEDGKYSFY